MENCDNTTIKKGSIVSIDFKKIFDNAFVVPPILLFIKEHPEYMKAQWIVATVNNPIREHKTYTLTLANKQLQQEARRAYEVSHQVFCSNFSITLQKDYISLGSRLKDFLESQEVIER